MFKMYDLNMKEIKFPEGLMPLEIFVSSIGKERYTDKVEGMPGEVNYGSSYTSRDVELTMWFNARDTIDYRLLRDELYAYFDSYDYFYVIETNKPTRALKIVIDDSIRDKRITTRVGEITINARTVDNPFWVSLYTTKELNDSGYSALVEKYGLVDGINDEYRNYRFTPNLVNQNIGAFAFKNGFISGSDGQESASDNQLISADFILLEKDNIYSFSDIGNNTNIARWWIYEYDQYKNFIGAISTTNKKLNFTAKGTYARFMIQTKSGSLSPEEVSIGGTSIVPKLERYSRNNTFSIWNAGNVTVTPEQMFLNITAPGASKDFEIINHTTGEHMILRGPHGGTFRTRGISYTMASVPMLRYMTKKQFISLAPGLNNIEIIGTFRDIEFDFRFYYK